MNKIFNMFTVKFFGFSWLVVHFISMVLYPAYDQKFNWQKIQGVWDRWQTLNAAMIALAASLIAFQVTVYREDKQRQRNFVAARSFLPEAFSELAMYCRQSARVFNEAYGRLPRIAHNTPITAGRINTPLTEPLPVPPEGYRQTFQECIQQADDAVAKRLSYILMRLQVHNSRLRELHLACGPSSARIFSNEDFISYVYRLAEIHALINRTFEFARGNEEFNSAPLTFEDFRNALSNLDVWTTDYYDLAGFITRAMARNNAGY